MPDCLTQPEAGIIAGCNEMHWRLVAWGAIMLRGGSGPRIAWESDDDQYDRREWSGADQDAARALHSLVIQLPEVRQRLVMQVFYREPCAPYWATFPPVRKVRVCEDLAIEVNRRIRAYNAQGVGLATTISSADFDGVRWRAIRMLVHRESAVPKTQQSVDHAGMGLATPSG